MSSYNEFCFCNHKVSRETVSRKLSYFQSENIIEIFENKLILIKDVNILKELVI